MSIPTYDDLMKRMLDYVPDTLDKREGSVIWDALSPAAYELAKAYEYIRLMHRNTFAGTADREGLVRRCEEVGLAPYEATYAIRLGIFTPADLEISIGERFNLGDINFVVFEKVEPGKYLLKCEEAGTVGNAGAGILIPMDYVEGLETATMSADVQVYGEDEEDTETLRKRYFDSLPTMTIDGNIAQYKKWCSQYPGIGAYKIFPLWNGKNTVKVSILSSENTAASQTLINEFQEYLDPGSKGLGNGQAPIGAVVTVSTATEIPINIHAKIQLKTGYDSPVGLSEELRDYLIGLNYDRSTVSYIAISATIQNNEAVEYVFSVSVNGGTSDIALSDEEITSFGAFTYDLTD